MSLTDIIINNYLSKDEIKDKLGESYSDEVWKETKQYRKRFADVTILPLEDKLCFVCLTPFIIAKYIRIEKMFLKLEKLGFKYETINDKSYFELFTSKKVDAIKKVTNLYGYDINDNILQEMYTSGSYEPKVEDEVFAFSACKAFEVYFDQDTEFSRDTIKKIYKFFDDQEFLRVRNITSNGVAKGIQKDKINSSFDKMTKFIEQSITPTIIKSIIINFYYRTAIFNSKYNDFMALVAMHLILASEEYKQVMPAVDLIGKVIEKNKEIEYSFKEGIRTSGDTTYYINKMLDILIEAIGDSIDVLKENLDQNSTNNSLKRKKIMARKLGLININLTKKQIWFLVNHHKMNENYTIEEYKSFNSSSYETARYSLDNLVKNGYYSKSKVGKKYIYKCIKNKIV